MPFLNLYDSAVPFFPPISVTYFSLQIKLKCIQMFLSIITHLSSEDAMPYIHYMAPKIAEYLYNMSASQPTTETERDLLLTSINCFELLIAIAEESKCEYMSHVTREPVFAICEQQRRRSSCASAQFDQHLCYSLLR